MYVDTCELCGEPFENEFYAEQLCDECFAAVHELKEEEELPCRS